MLVTRKHAASIHPAAKRKRLRYEHPFRTHCRCIGRTDGSATGRGKSGSSGATSATGAGREAKSFIMCVVGSPASSLRGVSGGQPPSKEQSLCQRSIGYSLASRDARREKSCLLSKNDLTDRF